VGGAGTGKTVVAMHRAVWLVRQLTNDKKVLFLTYNTNLAADIANNLKGLASSEELDRIEVINIDAWVTRFLKARKYSAALKFESDLDELWKDVLARSDPVPGKDLPDSFYTEEWSRIILPNRIDRREDYLRISRAGRGVALSRRQRAIIWNVFDDMRAELSQRGWKTYQDAMLDARDLIAAETDKYGYGHVVVDETQDMGPEALQLIRGLVPETQNDLFFVGDGHQRIYRRRAVMGQCGIKIVGRARKLKINYRTTEQIRQFASAVLDGLSIDDLDGGEDGSNDYLSLTRGPDPALHGFDSENEEIAWIIQHLKQIAEKDDILTSTCIIVRFPRMREVYYEAFRQAGLDAVQLERRADNQAIPGVRVANMHRVKGLEFRHVIMASMNDGVVPYRKAIKGSQDKTELRDLELAERALVHVCASRAIESLAVTWFGKPSDYLLSSD
jgi:superfamily I DNA/RNA helicase